MSRGLVVTLLALLLSATGCGPHAPPATLVLRNGKVVTMDSTHAEAQAIAGHPSPDSARTHLDISSSAFPNGGVIPVKYTCAGSATIPPLTWSGVPAGAASLALILDDTDVPGIFVHWVAYEIPPTAKGVPEGGPLPAGSVSGTNSTRHTGYFGPCPPKGDHAHHYHFRLYALDSAFSLAPGATKDALVKAMQGHVLAQGETVGTFARK